MVGSEFSKRRIQKIIEDQPDWHADLESDQPQALVVTVILNTNRKQDTIDCLASLSESTYSRRETIVLDNGSTDGSVEGIRKAFPEVRVVELTENGGYAGNNNVGIRLALEQKADWVLLLNEDTVLAPLCLQRMIQVGEADSSIGIVGPLVYHFDRPGTIQSAGGRLTRFWQADHIGQNESDGGQYREPQEVDWVSGCCILIRREVLQSAGLLDSRYFYYWEETDLCIRARKLGWRIVHVPGAWLWHKGVQAEYKPSPSVTYYATRNRFLTLSKNRAPLSARAVAWAQTARTLASWSIRPKWRSVRPHRDAMWSGVRDYLSARWGRARDF